MTEQSLKKKTVKGIAWSSIDNFAYLGITFVFTIMLARLLTPADYGTIALLTIFISVSSVLINSGFSNALIRKPDLNEVDKSTAFYFNVVVGLVAYAVLFLIAPLVSKFYGQPVLTPLLRVTAITLILHSLAIVQQTELSVRIDFKKQAYVSIISATQSGLLGLYFAYNGYGVWSLAIQQVSAGLFRTLMLWVIVKWKPTEKFSKESFNYLFGFGSKLLAAGLLNSIWSNIYSLIIGKVFSPAQLGLYSRAEHFALLPSSNLTTVFNRVTFPVLSKMQNEEEFLKINYRRLLKMSAFVIFPLMCGLSSVASPLINILIGEKWMGCVIYLQILCFALMWYPIHAINLNLLQVKGFSNLFLKLEFVKKVLGVVVLVVTIPFGLEVMCYGQVVYSIISLAINTHYTGEIIKVGFFMQMRDLLPTLIICVIMWGSVLLVVNVFQNAWLQLIIGVITYVVFYISVSYLLKLPEFQEIVSLIKKK